MGPAVLMGQGRGGLNSTMRDLCETQSTCGAGEGQMGGGMGGTQPSWGNEGLCGVHGAYGVGGSMGGTQP